MENSTVTHSNSQSQHEVGRQWTFIAYDPASKTQKQENKQTNYTALQAYNMHQWTQCNSMERNVARWMLIIAIHTYYTGETGALKIVAAEAL